jgi:hypothetical protein
MSAHYCLWDVGVHCRTSPGPESGPKAMPPSANLPTKDVL